MAATDGKPPGKATLVVSVAVLTILGAIGGALVGKSIAGKLQSTATPPNGPAEKTASAPYAGDVTLRELAPIVTNLAEPAQTRVRLQVAIVYPKKATDTPEIMAMQITDDIVAYMKTLSIAQLQGASGLQALREDLSDRATTRSNGKVRELMIENLVVQ